jgi:hypothetical protein
MELKEGLWWATRLQLASWAGYQSRFGPYGSRDRLKPSDGTVELIFAPEGRNLDPLTPREMQLILAFQQDEPEISRAVKQGIIAWCSPESVERSRDFDFDEASFPAIRDEEDLKRNIGLYAISIHQAEYGNTPYIGYEFGCEWEEEHGLGVLMHGRRVVEVGFADTAILLWIAEADAERQMTKR